MVKLALTQPESLGEGVDVERFVPGRGGTGVLYVGRLLPHKGVDYLIQAIPEKRVYVDDCRPGTASSL